MSLYTYCVTSNHFKRQDLIGFNDQRVDLLEVGELVCLTSEFTADSVSITRETVQQHESVVRMVLQEETPLPFRFGTLSSAQRLRSFLTTHQKSLAAKLEHVSGCVEMSIKIIAPRSEIQRQDMDSESLFSGIGAKFLLAKQRELEVESAFSRQAAESKRWLSDIVRSHVKAELVEIQPGRKLLLSASHLVKWSDLEDYKAVVIEACHSRPNLRFLKSGPWAPYSFSNINLEFNAQLGVS
jgi:gas vesicle protein GvpL/GvpF